MNKNKPWLEGRGDRGASTIWRCKADRVTTITENEVVVSFTVDDFSYDCPWQHQDSCPIKVGDNFYYDPTYRDITPLNK